ncbi:MAG: hypothetical protein WCJ29_03095 [bacterium]
MIYLIGGAPRSGKTILSKRIAAQKNISWISTDSIRAMVLAGTKKSLISKKFPYQKVSLEKNPAPELLRAEITESKTLWPNVEALIKQFIDCNEDYIVEGVHLMPRLVSKLKSTKYWKQIKIIYLVKDDLEKIQTGFALNTSAHDWLSGVVKDSDIAKRAARMVQIKSRYIAREARKCRFKVIVTDDDFNLKIKAAVDEWNKASKAK